MISELEAHIQASDLELRKHVIGLVEMKHQIHEELATGDIDVVREKQLNEALDIIKNQLWKVRYSGWDE